MPSPPGALASWPASTVATPSICFASRPSPVGPFAPFRFNAFAKHMPGVPQELSMLIRWYIQKVVHGAPSNTHADKIIEKVGY